MFCQRVRAGEPSLVGAVPAQPWAPGLPPGLLGVNASSVGPGSTRLGAASGGQGNASLSAHACQALRRSVPS